MRNKYIKTQRIFFCLLILFSVYSCSKKHDSIISSNEVTLKVNAQVAPFASGEEITNNKSSRTDNEPEVLSETTIALNNNLLLKAELAIENDDLGNTPIKMAQTPNGKKLANSIIANDVWYRLVVFNKETGAYVAERLFQRGKEEITSITPILKLDGGVHYTFIAYSVNSPVASALPALQGPSAKTLSNTYINITNADTELLFIKIDKVISGETSDNLNIIFERKTAQVTVNIDAKATGYNIKAITAKLLAKSAAAKLNFSNGSLDRSAGNAFTDVPLKFSTLDTSQVTSDPIVVNTGPHASADNFLTISSLTIDEHKSTDPYNLLKNVNLSAGKKYNLKITITPSDAYIENYGGFGIKVARINGQVWMRHNLRVDGIYSPTPDIGEAAIHGNYFQWGRKNPVSPLVNITSLPIHWSLIFNNNTFSWNGNTSINVNIRENDPKKASDLSLGTGATISLTGDPCPNGYRVPTKKEFEALVSSTKASYSAGAELPLTGVGILTSKRNANVKLTIPAQGTLFAQLGTLSYTSVDSKGSIIRLWNSYITYNLTNAVTSHFQILNSGAVNVPNRNPNDNNTSLGIPIRCIAVNSNLPTP